MKKNDATKRHPMTKLNEHSKCWYIAIQSKSERSAEIILSGIVRGPSWYIWFDFLFDKISQVIPLHREFTPRFEETDV